MQELNLDAINDEDKLRALAHDELVKRDQALSNLSLLYNRLATVREEKRLAQEAEQSEKEEV